MLTKISLRNFKRIGSADLELGEAVVFVGPNNSGKTSALQAIALWDLGVRALRSLSERGRRGPQTGIAINRKDLISLPIPNAKLLWKDLHVKKSKADDGSRKQVNILIDIIVEGVTKGRRWSCGLEFDFTGPESLYCRPKRQDDRLDSDAIDPTDELLKDVRVAFLPAMSGLASVEPRIEKGRINVLIGEGQTAQVLRNLCHEVSTNDRVGWATLVAKVKEFFGVVLQTPVYIADRGEIQMEYLQGQVSFDISCAGRGLQQTLLLLSYLYANPGTVLLLDEPDAHLEILRQREIYNLLREIGRDQRSQIVAASHSEVVLDEAIGKDRVIAFLGTPHSIENKSQLRKSLSTYGFSQYLLAEQKGFVIYLEGPTDLEILRAWSDKLGHKAADVLRDAFVHYVGNNDPQDARSHFYALREATPNLVGVMLFDRIQRQLCSQPELLEMMWTRREIENYFCTRDVLLAWTANDLSEDDLLESAEIGRRRAIMQEEIAKLENAATALRKPSPFSNDVKATDDFLEPLMMNYAERLGQSSIRKASFYKLVRYQSTESIPGEISEKLDAICAMADRAEPAPSD